MHNVLQMRRGHLENNSLSLSLDITNENIPHKTLLREVWYLELASLFNFLFLQVAWKNTSNNQFVKNFTTEVN